jgi:hypothetical protein
MVNWSSGTEKGHQPIFLACMKRSWIEEVPTSPPPPMVQQFPMGQDLLIMESSRSHLGHNTLGGTPLDEWSARRRDLYVTTHNTHKRQTSMTPEEIRTRNPTKPAAADPRLRQRDHWELSSGNTCYSSILNLSSSHWLPQNMKKKLHRTVFFLLFHVGVKLGRSHEVWTCLNVWCWGRCSGLRRRK